ncbi:MULTISPECIES: hypothetical protein [unclassified Streptomyces]|uniref:hypothetical protein n=1 Tax=unclassified Streptomyces TaxID=2593676 RepID=UPI000DAE0A71|nr:MULTISPECIES: hypothetical protein [unclassified Streptomyces]PZT75952.1 hypothetical protein DNK56_21400 [Streptomyces sp. AC1-42W]PZT80097.1 hypothetical protein DNK55_11285 [Streptomyces sp. AC1-42T]
MNTRRLLRAAAAAGIVVSAVAMGTGSAGAAEKDGWLTSGEFGLFCFQNQGNSVFDLYLHDDNFSNDYFKGSQSCAGHTTNDWTESYLNLDTYEWSVHTDSNGNGTDGFIPAGYRGDASSNFRNTISSAYLN